MRLCVCSLYDRCHLPRELQPSVTLANLLRYTWQRNSVTATETPTLFTYSPLLALFGSVFFFFLSLFCLSCSPRHCSPSISTIFFHGEGVKGERKENRWIYWTKCFCVISTPILLSYSSTWEVRLFLFTRKGKWEGYNENGPHYLLFSRISTKIQRWTICRHLCIYV